MAFGFRLHPWAPDFTLRLHPSASALTLQLQLSPPPFGLSLDLLTQTLTLTLTLAPFTGCFPGSFTICPLPPFFFFASLTHSRHSAASLPPLSPFGRFIRFPHSRHSVALLPSLSPFESLCFPRFHHSGRFASFHFQFASLHSLTAPPRSLARGFALASLASIK